MKIRTSSGGCDHVNSSCVSLAICAGGNCPTPPDACRRIFGDRIINAFFLSANMSQFAYVSLICGIDEQFKLLLCQHRATRNRESLRSACLAVRRPQKPTVRSRRIRNGRKVLPITLAFRQNLNPTSHVGNVRQLTDT
jgi:hypothetical protein